MNYFDPYPAEVRIAEKVAWQAQLRHPALEPSLRQLLERHEDEIFPQFVAIYRRLRKLPRGIRRDLARSALKRNRIDFTGQWPFPPRRDLQLSRMVAYSLSGLALLFVLEHGTAGAATIQVSTNSLNYNSDGRCSLLEAVSNAESDAALYPDCAAGSGADTILLPAKAKLSFQSGGAGNFYGDTALLVTSAITIEGNGAKISRKGSNHLYRLITVSPSGNLTLRNATLSGGREYYGGAILNAGNLTIEGAAISRATAVAGGAIFNAPSGTMAIRNSNLSKSTAYYGGAVFNYFGRLDMENSTISGNRAARGGGVSSYDGSVRIEGCEITKNRAADEGGGVHGRGASIAISNSTITKNTAYTGGGMLNYSGSFTIQSSVIASNKAAWRGGGTQSRNGDFTIESSLITKNLAETGAGVGTINFVSLNIFNSLVSDNRARSQGGGLEIWAGSTTIDGTTFARNRAGDFGGAIAFFSGNLDLVNSTISGNSSKTIGGGIWHQGTGTITNSTLTNNEAKQGGGIYNSSAMGQLSLRRNLVAGNEAGAGREIFNRTSGGAGTVHANDFNVVGASGNAGVYGFTLGMTDIVPSGATASILAPLADKGGPTPTHALVTGSPAIDAIPGAHPECAGTDQRGVGRPQGPGCDAGAFES